MVYINGTSGTFVCPNQDDIYECTIGSDEGFYLRKFLESKIIYSIIITINIIIYRILPWIQCTM